MKDKQHLVRMAAIFAAGVAVFLALQFALVPKTFGVHGHYRAAAIGEEAAKPLAHAGRAACAGCHAEVFEVHKGGKHARIGCESCHGPLAQHARDPKRARAAKPEHGKLCPVCHERNIARPAGFPQVDTKEHSSGEACGSCHQPHTPEV